MTESKPKFGEVGYKFLVEAEIAETDGDEECPYEVKVTLTNGPFSDAVSLYYKKEELVALISKTTPNFKKDYITQQLKDTKALVVSLEKELAAIK